VSPFGGLSFFGSSLCNGCPSLPFKPVSVGWYPSVKETGWDGFFLFIAYLGKFAKFDGGNLIRHDQDAPKIAKAATT
jgi:hypothetical protein